MLLHVTSVRKQAKIAMLPVDIINLPSNLPDTGVYLVNELRDIKVSS